MHYAKLWSRAVSRGFRAWIFLAIPFALCRGEAQTIVYAPPRFSDAHRLEKVQAVFPEVDQVFHELAETEKLPGLVYALVLDGKLVHTGAVGFANLELKTPASPNTAFRIASMTKSFVTLAIFKLRDAGKLQLDDPIAKYLPEFRKVQPPTSDSAPVTIRHFMTMSAGLPEDNPWGDRQMSISKRALQAFVSGGLSFSNPPGQEYEYSNLGFVLLGQVISKVSHEPFQRYITAEILRPLGMNETRWWYSSYPEKQLAAGYRWEHSAWRPEIQAEDGEGAACGGLITTLNDFARYVAMHLDAWPARDGSEAGPIRRATLRELHQPHTFSGMSPKTTLLDGATPNPAVSFYGYGLGWSVDSRGRISLAHSGGLPGFGSHYRFLPDYGVAVIAFANRTYAPVWRGVNKSVDLLVERAQLSPRAIAISAILQKRKEQVAEWITSWKPELGNEIAAANFFLDRSREDWMKFSRETIAKAGRVTHTGALAPKNQLRGTFPLEGENGAVQVTFTLTPERVPKVQELSLGFEPKP